MMKKKQTINDVLNSLGFTKEEGEGFIECVKAVKNEQTNDGIDAQTEMEKIIKKVIENEVQ